MVGQGWGPSFPEVPAVQLLKAISPWNLPQQCWEPCSLGCPQDLHPDPPCLAFPQLKARCEELKLDWATLSLEKLLKEKQALRSQISEKQRRCLELQVWGTAGCC